MIDIAELIKQELKLTAYYYLILIRNAKIDELEKLILHEEELVDIEIGHSVIESSHILKQLEEMDYIKILPDDVLILRDKSLNLWKSSIEDIKKVIAYLNTKCNKHFRPIEANNKFIRARLSEGYTYDDCLKAIDNCFNNSWFQANPVYLRPETIFNATKFQTYVQDSNNSNQISNYEMI